MSVDVRIGDRRADYQTESGDDPRIWAAIATWLRSLGSAPMRVIGNHVYEQLERGRT